MTQLHPEAQKLADYLLQNKPLDLEAAIAQFSQESTYDPSDDILPGWCVADVQEAVSQLTEQKQTVSREDAIVVLEKASRKMDASIGINWDVLQFWADDLHEDGEITFVDATPENSPHLFDEEE